MFKKINNKNFISLLILVLFVILAAGSLSDDSSEQSASSEPEVIDPIAGKKPTNSSWDGSVYEVKSFLKRNLKDPKSAEYIDWYKPFLFEYNGSKYWAVRVTYRAKNSFGGYVLNDQTFLIQNENVVTYFPNE